MGRMASRGKGRLRLAAILCLGYTGLISLQVIKSTTPTAQLHPELHWKQSAPLLWSSFAIRGEVGDGARLWVAILSETPPHRNALSLSLHHLPTSFISSSRHWEHSTTHLPPVNIAWRPNYTHPHSQTRAQSQRNFLQRWSGESTSNLWGIHSSERERVCTCVCDVYLCVWVWSYECFGDPASIIIGSHL